MSVDELPQEENDDDVDPTPQLVDPLLTLLLSVVERAEAEIPITVWVGGSIITGDLISERSYFRESIKLFESIPKRNEQTKAFSEGMVEGYNLFLESFGEAPAAGELAKRLYIQIKNPAVVGENRNNPMGRLWRCRIERIDAWLMGRTERS